MPDLLDAIKGRRSVRKYQTREVPKEEVEEVLTAAGWAPSAHNAQPWRFLVLADGGVKRKLALAMADAWAADLAGGGLALDEQTRKESVERFSNAPMLILACLTMEGMEKFPDERREKVEHDLAMQSLGAAIENLLLAAHSKGLGACWFCAPSFCKENVRKVLKIPVAVEPEALIALGYPAENPPTPTKKRLDEYCFLDEWGRTLV